MAKDVVNISGVWVHRTFDHLGGQLKILVEIDGEWRLLQTHDGPQEFISHITEVGGMLSAPVIETP